jgi:flagellar biosynthesis/type III secretory pathway chaperone
MHASNDTARSARAILDLDTRAIGHLRELLLEEQAALGARDADRLGSAVQRKLECLMQLERNAQERRELLRRSGSGDWNRLIATLSPELREAWEQLRVQLRDVADLTEVNEKIVNRTRHSTTRLLALLRGRTEEPDGVYDRSGRTSGYGDNRAITSA